MLYCNKCKKIVKPYDVWFLFNVKDFYQRKLEIGKCPKCKTDLTALCEIRKTDCKEFINRECGTYAAAQIDKCVPQLWYRQKDLKFKKGKPYGFVYGENRQTQKERKIFACDFFGNKELLEVH